MIFGISGPNELSAIERCPYYRGFRKERLDCSLYSKSRELRFTNSVIKKVILQGLVQIKDIST